MTLVDRNISGFMLLDKPSGISSHDAVQQVRKITRQRRVGHTGTLDPLATGLMILCLGSATKAARFVSDMDKTYDAEICLGRTSETFDAEGVDSDQPEAEIPQMSKEQLSAVLAEFVGPQVQTVPYYSAVSVEGRRLYDLARRGEEDIELPTREVEIKTLELNSYETPHIKATVSCSKGTYVRALAHDIGQRIGCGAYLSGLRRIAIGRLNVSNALTMEDITRYADDGSFGEHVLAYDKVFDYGAFKVTDEFERKVVSGVELRYENVTGVDGKFNKGDRVFIRSSAGKVLAIGTAEMSALEATEHKNDSRLFRYLRVLN